MAGAPLISVIIPAFNAEQTIARALDSIFSQTLVDFEVIVVDDGSTDDTEGVVRRFADRPLTIIRQTENRGAAAARNIGIAAARGKWIAFLDADDAWVPTKLSSQIAALEGQGAAVKACSTGYHLFKGGRNVMVPANMTPERFRRDILFGCTISPGSTLMVERDVFNRVGLFDESLRRLEDWDWLLRYSRHYDMIFVPDPLADVYVMSFNDQFLDQRYRSVNDAIHRIRLKHEPRFTSLVQRFQFRSSLLVERAALLHRHGRTWAAALNVMMALGLYPARNASFFRTLLRATADRFGKKS